MAEEIALTRIEAALRRIQADLSELGVRWALIGGFAVSARAAPRFTRDLDLAVTVPDDKAAEALVASLVARGHKAVAVVEQTPTSRLATVRLVPPGENEQGVVVDLLFASSGIEAEIVAAASAIEVLPSLIVPVARAGHLLAFKVLSRDDEERPQDAADIRALLDSLSTEDARLAAETAALIQDRGYARSRNIVADVRAALASRSR
ncbi:MAG: nucleotidyl transferase AbiEii/AbiGii toxin family protein [Thermoanaerobaculales bacterium]